LADSKELPSCDIEVLTRVLREELSDSLTKIFEEKMDGYIQSLLQGNFYKEMTFELRAGLDDIYRTLSDFKKALGSFQESTRETNLAFQEASDQLEAILRATEQATEQIMDLTEQSQNRLSEMEKVVRSLPECGEKEKLLSFLDETSKDFLGIITACSFQDITGQRVKKVVDTIKEIDKKLLELLVSSGIKIKGREEGHDGVAVEKEANKAVELLQGPQENVSQESVDDLLSELGL